MKILISICYGRSWSPEKKSPSRSLIERTTAAQLARPRSAATKKAGPDGEERKRGQKATMSPGSCYIYIYIYVYMYSYLHLYLYYFIYIKLLLQPKNSYLQVGRGSADTKKELVEVFGSPKVLVHLKCYAQILCYRFLYACHRNYCP